MTQRRIHSMTNSLFVITIGSLLLLSTSAFQSSPVWSQSNNRATTKSNLYMKKSLAIISPPGGIGEVTAVQAAKLGTSVRWFVISPPSSSATGPGSNNMISIPTAILESIASKGGSVELAGAQADSIISSEASDSSSSLSAVSTWCRDVDSVVCTLDGVEDSLSLLNNSLARKMEAKEMNIAKRVYTDAIKVVAKQACLSMNNSGVGRKVVVLPSSMDDSDGDGDVEEDKNNNGASNILKSVLKMNTVDVPKTLRGAMKSGTSDIAILRYGELFGVPQSSPNVSPFVGGPRRDPILRDEYTMRGVRIDPTLSLSGNSMIGSTTITRASRLAVGEAAALIALKSLDIMNGIDICLTSQKSLEEPTKDEWQEEFSRVQEMMTSGKGAQLFKASFGSVPNVGRLTDWIGTKWAPAVMKTYEIAGIRVGARPVYATKVEEGKIEIIWQQLKDFKTETVGKMIIEVSDTGLTAVRGPGDASAGYGTTSTKPLAGEDIMVRRLSDAATQAIEKGLAMKPAETKKVKKEVDVAPVVTTVTESGPVTPTSIPKPTSSESGPRAAGARRSSERARGRNKASSDSSSKDNSTSGSWE